MDPKVRLSQTWNRYADLYGNLVNERSGRERRESSRQLGPLQCPSRSPVSSLPGPALSLNRKLTAVRVCHRICLSIAACRTLLLPKICSIVKSCDSVDALWERHSDILSDQAIFLANLIRDTSTCEDGSFKAAVWALLVYVAGLKRMSL